MMTAHSHGLDTAGIQQHGPWSAPRPWALRGAEFTGNSSLCNNTVKPNSDALIAQALCNKAMDQPWSSLYPLRMMGILFLAVAPVCACAGTLWHSTPCPRRKRRKIVGYKRGGSAQRGRRNFNQWRWWVRWASRPRLRSCRRRKVYSSLTYLQHLLTYLTRAVVTLRTAVAESRRRILPLLWLKCWPPHAEQRWQRPVRVCGIRHRLCLRVRMLHLSMLLYMVNAEQDTLYQALSVPHLIVLAGLALTAVVMLRLKRRRITWRFDRGDLVWVHTGQDGEGCAPAEVEGRCTMGSAMGRGLRYRISYAEGYDGPQRVEDSCLRPRTASEEETAGGADEDTCVPAEEAANPANSPISIDMCEGPAATDGGDANPPSSLALSAGMRIRVLQADGRRRSGTILAHDEVRALAYIWYDAAELGDAREEQVPTDKNHFDMLCGNR